MLISFPSLSSYYADKLSFSLSLVSSYYADKLSFSLSFSPKVVRLKWLFTSWLSLWWAVGALSALHISAPALALLPLGQAGTTAAGETAVLAALGAAAAAAVAVAEMALAVAAPEHTVTAIVTA